MTQIQEKELILLYYNIRGKTQVIRNLLCYLAIPFVELHLQQIEAGIETPNDRTLSQLKAQPVDRTKLPLLVDQGEFVYGTFAINMHLCTLAQRGDLFGRTDSQVREVQRMLQLILQLQMKSKTFILQFAEKCLNKSDREIKQLLHFSFENFMNSFSFVRELCLKLEQRQNLSFILEDLTIVDFYFMESCFYILGVWGFLDRDYCRSFESFYNSVVSPAAQRPSSKHFLETMRRFYARMGQMPYYRTNRDYLESFPVIHGLMSAEKTAGLRRLWVGDMKYMN